MSMQIFGKKALAVMLSLAMLASCMVFSFSASAAETLMWENDFNNGTDTNWKKAYTNPSDCAWYSNNTNTATVYDTTDKAMALSFKSATSWTNLVGFAMFHKEATNATAGAYGYHGGETSSTMIDFGAFRPAKGNYKITLDYKVTAFSDVEGAAVDLCIGFAKRTQWKWYSSVASRADFINSTNGGVYDEIVTVDASDLGDGWASATLYMEQPVDDAMLMHIFARTSEGVTNKSLAGTTVMVDNVKVYAVDSIPTNPPSNPDDEEDDENDDKNDPLMWENAFDNGSDTNWKKAYTQGDNAWYSNNANTAAAYDATNKAMALSFKSANAWMYLSGFAMFHKEATNNTADAYGYHGGETSDAMIAFGAFRPAKGYYTVSLDYKVTDFSTADGAAIDLCVGFANRTAWKWYSSVASRADFVNSTNGGVYKKIATVTASDKGADWKTVTLIIEQASDTAQLMHIFARTSEGVSADLNGSTVLVDNVKVSKYQSAAGYVEPDDLTADIKMWDNNFENGSDSNWLSAYQRDDKAWSTNNGATYATYDSDNKAMKLSFKGSTSASYMAGFTVFHKATTHSEPDVNGYHGGEENNTMKQYGAFLTERWKYTVKFKYQVTAFSDADGAAMDIAVGFASRANWKWWGNAKLPSDFLAADKGAGVYYTAATVTASDVGTGWHEVSIDVVQPSDESMLMQLFATGSGTDPKNLNGAAVLIDDIEVYKKAPDEDFTNISFYYNGIKVGQSKKALPGMKFVTPTLALPTIPDGYKVVYYSDAACTNLIDAPTTYPAVSTDLYVRIVYDTGSAWGFETEADNTRLSLNEGADTTVYTDDAVTHTGDAAARVDAPAITGSANLYPQVILKDGLGKTATVGKDRDYEVRFFVNVPSGQSVDTIKYWLAACNDEGVFDEDYDAEYSSKHFLVAEGTETISTKGEWVEIVVPITSCAYSGKLRLGIVGDASAAHHFYIDDVAVLSLQSDPNAWSFETEAVGKRLSVNDRIPNTTIYVDNSHVYTGRNAARVNSDGGANRTNHIAQMMVKNSAGEQVRVYKNRNYEITFYVFVPSNQADYDLTYWFTATEQETVFDRNYDDAAYSRKNYTVAEGTADLTVGEWTEVTVTITNCAYSGKLRIGLNGNSDMNTPFYIDDIGVNESTTDPLDDVDSFELYGNDHTLSLNTDGASITVTDSDRHHGEYSAEIVTLGNDVDAAPQMVINNYRGDAISVEKGKSYRVTFWVTQPADHADYDIQYWFAATDSDAAFTDARQNVVLDTQTVVTTEKHSWQKVTADITDVAYSGKLRLGITGSSDEAHIFYVDDILVKEVLPSDMEAMNFENYEIGTDLALNSGYLGTSIIITDEMSYTGGQSAFFHAKENTGDNRPHMNVKDAYGNQVKVKKGENFYVSFMIYIPETEPHFTLSYWIAAVPDDVLEKPYKYPTEFGRNLHVLPGEKHFSSPPDAGVWTEIKIAVLDCPREGNLRIGITHGNGQPFQSNFYIDDIKIYEPEYVLVKFDTNGSEDVYPDQLLLSDMLIPYDGVDPYRPGYEFLGWYTSKTYDKNAYFDIYTTPVVGKTGDVLTLYAHWREWDDGVADGGGQKEEKYKIEYYTKKVWVGDQNVPENPYPSVEFEVNDAAPIVTTPDEVPDDGGGLPPWLMVVIIVGAVVVVGGGAVLAALLLKKSKKKEEA